MRSAPRTDSLMGAIRASRQNCSHGGKSNGAGISHTASGSRPRCGQLIRADEALDLIDGVRVHMKGYCCRMAYEQRWRRAATDALTELGLQPPVVDGDGLP